ncbi:hypothetical protein llg_30610 [Luteolibacter sp. LG18]|nr:hypothetical protein llg_30610 [Luteolibacter sp. LG18]
MALAFWAGRASTPDLHSGKTEPEKRATRSASRSTTSTRLQKIVLPGAGGEAITTALQLRDFFKHSGGNYENGKAMAEAALSKMNANELSQLVADLADAQASTPGYGYSLEIGTACSRWAAIDPEAALRFVLSAKQSSFRSAAIGGVLASIAQTDPALARQKLEAIQDSSLKSAARSQLMSALAVSQPDAWIAMMAEDPTAGQRWSVAGYVGEWAVDDPAAAAARLAKLPAGQQFGALSTLGKVWGAKDRAAATAWANSLPEGAQRTKALVAVAAGIAASDPDAALASLSSLSSTARRSGVNSIFGTLADRDFDSALARATALSDPTDQRAAFQVLMGADNNDPYSSESSSRTATELHSIIGKLPEGTLRDQAITQLGSRLGYASREEAERILQSFPEGERQRMQTQMLSNLSYNDPARALEIYQSLPTSKQGSSGSYTFENILEHLAPIDPEAAMKAAKGLTNPAEQGKAIGRVLGQMAKNDPEAARSELSKLPAGPVRDAGLTSLAQGWGASDPTAALAWVQSLPAEERSKTMLSVLPAMARSDSPAAAEALMPLLSNPAQKDTDGRLSSTASQIASQWFEQDPDAAAQWATALPEGSTRDNTVQSLVYSWCNSDPDGASKWINSMPDGKTRDNAVGAMVGTKLQRDPATAYQWAESIADDRQREASISNVIQNWNSTDPSAARAAAEKADISNEQRASLLQILDREKSSPAPSSDPFADQ